ncbi:uncharacterized protein LOC108098997 [Drosophila ficusphila]|uniref:uncharacterized protein LOC108098997 n=1 Tax=Drosophila ficusphila TaxID=30025 RepID=UPI0007E65906|nr:uncharacterized protein LOC108098997 [Drosophila ficusphila]
MALADEGNYAFVKQVALDWRELVRERRQSLLSPTQSIWMEDAQLPMVEPKARTVSMIAAERRESSFYRHRFSQPMPVAIERREVGSILADFIQVSDDVQLFIYQPIHVSPSLRASIQAMSLSELSVASTNPEQHVVAENAAKEREPILTPGTTSP